MSKQLSILCVHGIGHGDADLTLVPSWTDAVVRNVQIWDASAQVKVDFFRYDDLFDQAPQNMLVYGEAIARLLASGVLHGIGDLFSRERGLSAVPGLIRWTAGMIAQWAANPGLRAKLRDRLMEQMASHDYDVTFAHSLGSLLCYDTFRRKPAAIKDKTFVTLGSQIGNPFVRDCFAGRIEPLAARTWFHLYNRHDSVFTSHVRLPAGRFVEVQTDFDKPSDPLNHDARWYLNHTSAQALVWRDIAGDTRSRRLVARSFQALEQVDKRPDRRALLIGINNYPNESDRLEGCVNDVFLMSSLLQECGFAPEEIRVVLDERATASGIMERMHWLLDEVESGAERVLFYSGHGAQIPAYDFRGETDHVDECLVPHDFDWTPERAIRDKQFAELYSQLPYDSRFVAILDCCHSGGMTRQGGPKIRGLNPPDDIRHRTLRWDVELEMWQERELKPANRSLAGSKHAQAYLGKSGATYRMGRGITLRGLPDASYDAERKALRHRGAYMPVLLEACGEQQSSYEYRHGVTSYGAYTYSLVKLLREARQGGANLTFKELSKITADRLEVLGYDQKPCLIGPRAVIGQPIPWTPSRKRKRRAAGTTRRTRARA